MPPGDSSSRSVYPHNPAERDRWILQRRGPRHAVDPRRPNAFWIEQEPDDHLRIVSCATILLANRECPWRCLMCDLWKQTLPESVPPGAVPEQIQFALQNLDRAEHVKLYNSGSFFDPQAIPPADHEPIARLAQSFSRVIVECHPALINDAILPFRDQLSGRLEIAMGLETADPATLEKLNKRMTLEQFARAAGFLRMQDIALRVFILIQPPFITNASAALHWARRSIDFAFDCGARVASLIPTRAGNGAMEALAAAGDFVPPRLDTLESSLEYGLATRRGRVFADLWNLERSASCPACFPQRRARLATMNLTQRMEARIQCANANCATHADTE